MTDSERRMLAAMMFWLFGALIFNCIGDFMRSRDDAAMKAEIKGLKQQLEANQ
jgi:hypothetical protein